MSHPSGERLELPVLVLQRRQGPGEGRPLALEQSQARPGQLGEGDEDHRAGECVDRDLEPPEAGQLAPDGVCLGVIEGVEPLGGLGRAARRLACGHLVPVRPRVGKVVGEPGESRPFGSLGIGSSELLVGPDVTTEVKQCLRSRGLSAGRRRVPA